MKKNRVIIFCLTLTSLMFSVACYEPIANTSGGKDPINSSKNKNKNTSVNRVETVTNVGKTGNSTNKIESAKTETMKDGQVKSDTSTKTAEGFKANLSQSLSKNGLSVSGIYDASSSVESRILAEYGSVFLTKAMPPSKVMFTSEQEVSAFQKDAGSESAKLGGINVQLQPAALNALRDAAAEAKASGLSITPRDKKPTTDSAKRSYNQTLVLWKGRVDKACKHWKGKKRLTTEQIANLKALPIKQQVKEVLELEKQGVYFNTFFNGSILQSVAAPGTSQHISMLAFDVTEFQNKKVREILAKYGWFRTVASDEPHFTYLGHKEDELQKLGLKKVSRKGGEFWVPNM